MEVRIPTRLTRLLQIALPGFFDVIIVGGWVQLLRPVSAALARNEGGQATLFIVSWFAWTGLAAVLTVGSVRRWRWTFWLLVALLAWWVVFSIPGTKTTSLLLVFDVVSSVIAAVLVVASLVGAFRYGTWAMKRAA